MNLDIIDAVKIISSFQAATNMTIAVKSTSQLETFFESLTREYHVECIK